MLKLRLVILVFFILSSYHPIFTQQCFESQNNIYYVKDIGEAAYFLNEKLQKCGVLARTIIIRPKTREILFDHSTGTFIHTEKTKCAYEGFVLPIMRGGFPSPCVPWLTLSDPKKCSVFICTFDGHGHYIDLRPYLIASSQCEN